MNQLTIFDFVGDEQSIGEKTAWKIREHFFGVYEGKERTE